MADKDPLINQVNTRIRHLSRNSDNDDDVLTLTLMRDTYTMVANTQKQMREFPSLLWLIWNRPLSTIPFVLGLVTMFMTLTVLEARVALFKVLNIPAEIVALFADNSLTAVGLLFLVAFIAEANYRRES